MIDIHSHILPGIDDGARELVESRVMARIAADDGITHMVATPHMFNGLSHDPCPEEIVERVGSLQQEIGDALRLLPGNEVRFAPDLLEKLADGKVTPLNRKNYVLVEFPSSHVPAGAGDLFERLQEVGITPILVHPERNRKIQGQPSLISDFIRQGARVQVTAMSVTGEFGSAALQCAETLLRHRCVHFLATDSHRAARRMPVLSRGRDAAAGIVGHPAAARLVEDNPRAVIEGRPVECPDPILFETPRRVPFLKRLFRR